MIVASSSQARELLPSLKVLADPNRLRMLDVLIFGARCNCDLGEALDMAPNLISHHLRVLRKAGLVDAVRDAADARWVYYSINQETLRRWHAVLTAFLDPRRIALRQPDCGPTHESHGHC